MAKLKTHYDNLKISRNAPAGIIKAAYKTLCQNYHPDKFKGECELANQIIRVINKAYCVLSDPIKRAEHDRWIDKKEGESGANIALEVISNLETPNHIQNTDHPWQGVYHQSNCDPTGFYRSAYHQDKTENKRTWIV